MGALMTTALLVNLACLLYDAKVRLRQQVQHLYPDREGLLRWEDDTGT